MASLAGLLAQSRSASGPTTSTMMAFGDDDSAGHFSTYPHTRRRQRQRPDSSGQFRSMLDVEEPPTLESIDMPPEKSMEECFNEKSVQKAQKHVTNDWTDILCFYTATNGAAPVAPTRASPAPNGKPVSPQQMEIPQSVSSSDPKIAAQQASDMRNIVRRKLTGYVGFANLPNQWHRKSVRKGFNFNVMVVGE